MRGTTVECLVPTWAGLGDTLGGMRRDTVGDAPSDLPGDMFNGPREAMLVVVGEAGPFLSWVFVRGVLPVS